MIKNKTKIASNDQEHERRKQIGRERAARIKTLRESCRYSRHSFCEKYKHLGINSATLQSWEDVRWYGVSERGIASLVEAFRLEGLSVTAEWIMYGIGDPPIKERRAINKDNIEIVYDANLIAQELQYFLQLHENIMDVVIRDNANAPMLQINDRAAGPRCFGAMIEDLIGHVCIVDTVNNTTLVRKLEKGTIKGCYDLVALNPDATHEARLENEVLYCAAPIVWLRKVVRPQKYMSTVKSE